MASGTRTITAIGVPAFDFITERKGSFTVFSNDLNIDFRVLVTPPVGPLQLVHAGPILFATSALTGAGVRVQVIPLTIGTSFPPPQGLSLVQVQSDTVRQVPTD